MKKFRLLLLDANIVIILFRLNLWEQVLDRCEVHLARVIVEDEAHFYEDDQGGRHDFDLKPYEQDGRINVFDVPVSQVVGLKSQFDQSYVERMDPGETASLAYLLNSREEFLISSADSIVYRILGHLRRAEQGISLQEILNGLGMSRQLAWPFTRAFRELWTTKGFQDGL